MRTLTITILGKKGFSNNKTFFVKLYNEVNIQELIKNELGTIHV